MVKKKLALIGENVKESKSKIIHEKLIDCDYELISIDENNLAITLDRLKSDYNGFNVTIPYKENVMKYLDRIDDTAKIIGAVNTVKVVGGKLIGYNTDCYGFSKSLDSFSKVKIENVLLLGCGGASRGVLFELLKRDFHIDICNRTYDKAIALIDEFNCSNKASAVSISEGTKKKYDLIVNTTSVGMHDDSMPIEITKSNAPKVLIDIINKNTRLLKIARLFGSKVMNGLSMLVYQAVKADMIFDEIDSEDYFDSKVDSLLKELL